MRGVSLVITQQDLADYAGSTRSTLNAHLRSFEATGALQLARGRITITDSSKLDRFI
jgi:CRP-like cAMP-binding protein